MPSSGGGGNASRVLRSQMKNKYMYTYVYTYNSNSVFFKQTSKQKKNLSATKYGKDSKDFFSLIPLYLEHLGYFSSADFQFLSAFIQAS